MIFYALFTGANIIYFFDPASPALLYYHILMAWDPLFVFFYTLNIAAIILNVLVVFPLWAYLHGRHFLSAKFWMCLFWTRLILEFFGRSYETNYIKSIYADHPTAAYLTVLTLVIVSFPSYLMLWLYAGSFSRRD